MKTDLSFSTLLERFFTQRLIAQRQASPHTIASYRDTFRLLLRFAGQRLHTAPSALTLADLAPAVIGAFLDSLESGRGNSARSRNLRLTAIRSFFRYAAFEDPAQSGLIQRVLAMPSKRYENLALKEQALAKTAPANAPSPGRYRPDDQLLAFLRGL